MKYVILPLMLSVCAYAKADEIVYHTVSIHSQKAYEDGGSDKPYNNINLGIGYRTDKGWMGGVYINSYDKVGGYVAKEFMFTNSFGMIVGVATGYKVMTGKTVSPVGAFLYKYPLTETLTANVYLAPPIKANADAGVAHLAISQKF